MSDEKPMFPHTVDSTMLASFRSCPYKFFRQYVQHWKPKAESVHLVAGGAFAKGIEVARRVYFEGLVPVYEDYLDEQGLPDQRKTGEQRTDAGDSALAMEEGLKALLLAYGNFDCPPESAKSPERMAGALEFYFEQYPLGADGLTPLNFPDGRTGIEFSFAQPLPVNHPVTGDPILYTGRSDLIGEFAGGRYVVDEKTTSSLGASWGRQWEMRSQFTGYTWASGEAGLRVDGVLVRGVSILKTKYDTLQHVTYRAEFEVDRWLDQTCRDILRMIEMWKSGHWDYSLDHACAEYGGCSLLQICKSPQPENWLETYFERRVWDPLARRELTVAEWEESWGHKSPGITTE